jgi:manganese transport protein
MLVASQVVLSLQLPFAVIPLIWFTASRRRMGVFAVAPWVAVIGWLICAMVVAANGWMVWSYWAVRWF